MSTSTPNTMIGKDDFLNFEDADVKITMAQGWIHHLHSDQLCRSSPVLKRLLVYPPGQALSASAKEAGVCKFHIALLDVKDEWDPRPHQFQFYRVPIDEDGEPGLKREEQQQIISSLEYESCIAKDISSVFGAIYNQPLDLANYDIQSLVIKVMDLISAAELLANISVISKPVEAALLSQGQTLFRSIAASPVTWLSIGDKLESRLIFREALCHAVGTYNSIKIYHSSVYMELRGPIKELLDHYAHTLDIMVERALQSINSYYPSDLRRNSEGGRPPGCSEYATDVIEWMALVLLKQWFSQIHIGNLRFRAEDGGHGLVWTVFNGGQAYLTTADRREFHRMFDMTPRAKNVFENHLETFKNSIKCFVAELVKNKSQLNVELYPQDHLTCLTIADDDEYPWEGTEAIDTGSEEEADSMFGSPSLNQMSGHGY